MKIDITDLSKTFGTHQVLKNISLSLENAHALVIIGPSGGGKTTFLRVLAGLEAPENGSIEINDRRISFDDQHLREYRKHVGMVFQSFNLFPHMTALENIVFPLEKVHGVSSAKATDRAMGLLSRFHLEEHSHKKPGALSGGQKQRIALSRAIAIVPEFLILDEPTSALDPEFTGEVLDMIRELREEDIHLMLVTHEMGFARHVADHVLFLDDGVVVAQGPPESIFENPDNSTVKRFLERVLRY